jgi:hypothetical protein
MVSGSNQRSVTTDKQAVMQLHADAAVQSADRAPTGGKSIDVVAAIQTFKALR